MKNTIISVSRGFPDSINTDDLQNTLEHLHTSSPDNHIDHDQWFFRESGRMVISFVPLKELGIQYPEWTEQLGIRPDIIAKILFIDLNKSSIHEKYFLESFDFICKTLFFLAEHNRQAITKACLDEFLTYVLTHSSARGSPTLRLTPPTFGALKRSLNIGQWLKTCQSHGLENVFFSHIFPRKTVIQSLKKIIPVITEDELTFQDWAEGGTLNNLTLDYGRFYIEHCVTVFEEHYALAIALRSTLSHRNQIMAAAGLTGPSISPAKSSSSAFMHFLLGGKPEDTGQHSLSRHSLPQQEELTTLYHATRDDLKNRLLNLKLYDEILSTQAVNEIANTVFNKTLSFSQAECFRHLIEARLSKKDILPYRFPSNSPPEDWLISVLGVECPINTLDQAIEKVWNRLTDRVTVSIPTMRYYQSLDLGKKKDNPCRLLKQFLKGIQRAGLTVFVALTGWRRSEYGFSLKDIRITANRDLLDQQNHPWRYEVFWYVPKTNGTTKLHREITHTCYQYALRIASITGADAQNPCLYSFTRTANSCDSSARIYQGTTALWGHYVRYYTPFTQIDQLKELTQLESRAIDESLNDCHKERLKFLRSRSKAEHWERLTNDTQLINAYERSRKELPRVELYLDNKRHRASIIENYCNRSLPEATLALLDSRLSQRTIEKIHLMTPESARLPMTTRAVMNEMMGETLYPTPHAFRHMWAEAVYRRFDRDAGWMIRSSFKHVSQNMWLAYIHEKDNRRQHDKIKRRVCSTLLKNYLHKAGEGYAGALDKLLRRMFLNTHTVKIADLEKAIEQFADNEIDDIKSNPWGYCILLRRNLHRAKCAEDGSPQRHNASPALCLGCINNLTQTGNIDGLLLNISNDLQILKSPVVPETLKTLSRNTVTHTINHLQKLGAEQDILNELQKATDH